MILGNWLNIIGSLGSASIGELNGFQFASLFVVFRILLGVGFGIASTANLAILAKLYPNELARAVSLIETVSGIGMAVGPFIGAYTYAWFGFKGPYIFLLIGFLIFESVI